MKRLNQVIAIEKGVKTRVYADLTTVNKVLQSREQFNGMSRQYEKINDEDESLPGETKNVTANVNSLFRQVEKSLSELFDVTFEKDFGNTTAFADVVVEGQVLLKSVPATYLLFLEKQLNDVKTLVKNIPVLSNEKNWSYNDVKDLYQSDEDKTARTKKVQEGIVLYPATETHPAQTQLITKDVVAGYWKNVAFSSAFPQVKKDSILRRVETLIDAVKTAREEANMQEITTSEAVGSKGIWVSF